MSDNIYVNLGPTKQTLLLAAWPHGRTEVFGELYERVARAGRIVDGHASKVASIRSDTRLSPKAQLDDQRAAGEETLKALSTSYQLLGNIAERLAEERAGEASVEPYKAGDVATVMIDLALAEQVRTADHAKLLRSIRFGTHDPRTLEAIVRLPTALTGLTEGQKSEAIAQAIYHRDPAAAQVRRATDEALAQAEYAHKSAAKILSDEFGVTGFRATLGLMEQANAPSPAFIDDPEDEATLGQKEGHVSEAA